MNKRKYNGYDWAEVAQALNIPYDMDINSPHFGQEHKHLEIYLTYLPWHKDSRSLRYAVHQMRTFVDALIIESEQYDYWSPLWKGLAQIEDDYTFMSACIALVGHMWN